MTHYKTIVYITRTRTHFYLLSLFEHFWESIFLAVNDQIGGLAGVDLFQDLSTIKTKCTILK